MEKILFEHIEFLLPKHKCVIIPNFGGFILNADFSANDKTDTSWLFPDYAVIFNQELKYDDGILINSLVLDEGISYEVARNKVKTCVKQLKQLLLSDNTVKCGNLGSLHLFDDNNLSFEFNKSYVYPANFGLTNVRLSLLENLSDTTLDKQRIGWGRYIWAGTAAAIIGTLVFMLPSSHIDNLPVNQHAGFVYNLSGELDANKKSTNIISQGEAFASRADSINIFMYDDNAVAKNANVSGRTYYIVVGGDDDQLRVDKVLKRIKSEGFQNADIVKSADRYRIYIASFGQKDEAERFLEIFRLENPKYSSAWLYSKRNNS